MVRSEGHWREGYCVSHISHPAVSSDHTLSGPGSVGWMCLCVPACVYLSSSRADDLEESLWIIYEVITPAS